MCETFSSEVIKGYFSPHTELKDCEDFWTENYLYKFDMSQNSTFWRKPIRQQFAFAAKNGGYTGVGIHAFTVLFCIMVFDLASFCDFLNLIFAQFSHFAGSVLLLGYSKRFVSEFFF